MKHSTLTLRKPLLDDILKRTFYCKSCSTWRMEYRLLDIKNSTSGYRRASTLSSTAVNAIKPVPKRFKPLHEALANIGKKASAHVNLSRLSLALQSLESERPTIRIALLGIDLQDTARRLIRLILADPLEDEGKWEQQILEETGTQGLLIRYGQPQNSSLPQRTTVPILHIPAPLLRNLNVEVLLSSISGSSSNGTAVPIETFLSPAVGTPTDASGRQVTINQPVHHSFVIGNGFDQLMSATKLLNSVSFQSEQDRELIDLIVNISNNTTPSINPVVIDVQKAEEGIEAIRESVSGASIFGNKWAQSGLSNVSESLTLKIGNFEDQRKSGILRPVQSLISSILTAASANIAKARQSSVVTNSRRTLNSAVRHNLISVVDDFSRSAHQELQAGLESAWSSRNWRKLAWYKLFWRVDDVGLIVTDLVTSAWLPRTERAVYELSGRLIQVGITPVMAELQKPGPDAIAMAEIINAPVLESSAVLSTTVNEVVATQPVIRNKDGVVSVAIEPPARRTPIASAISNARNAYIYNATTSLTSNAQQLVLRTFSISGMSAGLSSLVYMSSLSASMYEAGTIFAIGTVFALWRLQSGWQNATRSMEHGLFEEGRNVISGIVNRMRSLVDDAAQTPVDPVEQAAIEDAQQAVDQAKIELRKLESTSQGEEKVTVRI